MSRKAVEWKTAPHLPQVGMFLAQQRSFVGVCRHRGRRYAAGDVLRHYLSAKQVVPPTRSYYTTGIYDCFSDTDVRSVAVTIINTSVFPEKLEQEPQDQEPPKKIHNSCGECRHNAA